ncbi:hypothetical protein BCR33DRAFT_787417 [Rhizoclosmatium globosum]|uniref:Uncharacterized protein n=1 Tax=Rhizoclosmatium globosum TaxID=329046 RepID=A0A1Y2C158_9FUNG|nr:hypothetical protein BCR33DRAFT_787417 [Rhizoclosmatium globosum]|eukprot:ORY40768.1 hypothetical protein BCR33DRAFT_787417 [Rhizoclosmatium globosum]
MNSPQKKLKLTLPRKSIHDRPRTPVGQAFKSPKGKLTNQDPSTFALHSHIITEPVACAPKKITLKPPAQPTTIKLRVPDSASTGTSSTATATATKNSENTPARHSLRIPRVPVASYYIPPPPSLSGDPAAPPAPPRKIVLKTSKKTLVVEKVDEVKDKAEPINGEGVENDNDGAGERERKRKDGSLKRKVPDAVKKGEGVVANAVDESKEEVSNVVRITESQIKRDFFAFIEQRRRRIDVMLKEIGEKEGEDEEKTATVI